MDRSLPDRPVIAATQIRQCPEHGEYTARQLFGERFEMCPECSRKAEERRAVRHAEEMRLAAEQRAAAALERNLKFSGLIGRFKRVTFETFEAATDPQRKALQACQDFAGGDLKGGAPWLIGRPGVGKTHLAASIVSHVIRQRGRGACIHGVHEIMQMLRARMGAKKEARPWEDEIETLEELRDWLGRVPLLVLDEIGVSRGSDWEAEQLFTIVDARYRHELPTIVVSNLPAGELKPLLGDRVYDRLREGSRMVPMAWDSHRGSRT
ncbi:ATP-binding protein [Variovorax guangxiensis]|uniref:ATP-binding protein n=1 Tax=Variovorax guangxiensis TaxID=1775474 RepID=UPI002855777C|nr:ATP-binding protein [Variovorax guangxiensis]MDR6857231.1 DNA replication protein DnaC [Variovorax guangxiensis]